MSLVRALARLSRSRGAAATGIAASYGSTASAAGDVAAAATAGELRPSTPGREKPRVVVLGTGWAGCRLMKGVDTRSYDVVCVSPRNHMVFTPLLASTCVGTLEFRSVAEPIGRIQPAVATAPGSYFFLARCTAVDPDAHTVHCKTVIDGDARGAIKPWEFTVSYDKLVIACGAEASTMEYQKMKRRDSCIVSLLEVVLQSGVRLVHGIVKDVLPDKVILSDGTEVPYGLLVWSTGVGPSPFIKSLTFPKSPGGRIGVDEWLRVPSVQDVFAIGDCSGFLESTGKLTLPALAQVAERQGKYLAHLLNKIGKDGGGYANTAGKLDFGDPFVYKHIGSMSSVGRYKALVDLRKSKDEKGLSLAGFGSWFIWRSAYLTRVISWRNRFYVAINWLTTLVFGRDISRI